MLRLIRDLLRPFRASLALVLSAMIVETLMSLAGPWPLKIVLDQVLGGSPGPLWLARMAPSRIALWAGVGTIAIAAVGAGASYLESYWSERVAQGVAHDLRMRTYHHLQRLSLSYHDKHQVSSTLSTLTTDIETIQDFASSGTLAIVIDVFSVVGMLALMFWLNWQFAFIAAGVAPVLLWFVARFKRAVKRATARVRVNQAEMVAVELYGLQSQRVVEAFGTEDWEERRLGQVSRAAVESALDARRIKSSLSPLIAIAVSVCTAIVL